jgi:hypothetical protein
MAWLSPAALVLPADGNGDAGHIQTAPRPSRPSRLTCGGTSQFRCACAGCSVLCSAPGRCLLRSAAEPRAPGQFRSPRPGGVCGLRRRLDRSDRQHSAGVVRLRINALVWSCALTKVKGARIAIDALAQAVGDSSGAIRRPLIRRSGCFRGDRPVSSSHELTLNVCAGRRGNDPASGRSRVVPPRPNRIYREIPRHSPSS